MTDILLYADRFTTLSAKLSKLRERHPEDISFHSVVLKNEVENLLKYPIITFSREGQEIFREFVCDEDLTYSKVKELIK